MTPEKTLVVRALLRVLRSPLILMSVPDREKAFTLATEHEVTALDLIEVATKEARNR